MLSTLNVAHNERVRKGGWRQCVASADCDNRIVRSHLGELSLLGWCEGTLTGPKTNLIARAGVRDGLSQPLLVKLANCGSESNSQRVQQDMLRLLDDCGIRKQLTFIRGCLPNEAQVLILPTTMFKLLGTVYPVSFHRRLATKDQCQRFWSPRPSTSSNKIV